MSGRRKEKRRFRRTAGPGRPCRCLDAAHGKGIGPIASGQRIHKGAVEPQQAPAMTVRDHGRRGPRIAIRADIAQVSRSAGAVARSRPGIREQSLEWMPRRGNKFNSEFTMQNCEIICHSEEQSDEESVTLPKIDSSMTIMASMPHIAAISLVRKSRCQGFNPCARDRLASKMRPPQPARASIRRMNIAD